MTITWIMQVNLGKYDNAPKDSLKKFKRAVKSFIDMKDEDTSLIIVSDGCQIAHKTYFKEFSKIKNIKYAFVEKTTPYMYDEYNDEPLSEYHRVGTRQLGRMLVDSTLTTYLDADDFLLPNAAKIIRENWKKAEEVNEINWAINSRWYDPSKVNEYIENTNYHGGKFAFGDIFTFDEPIKIKGLTGKYQQVGIEKPTKKVANYAMNFIHRSGLNVSWKDTVYGIKGGSKADVNFSNKLQKIKGGAIFEEAYYVRCRYSNLWDV